MSPRVLARVGLRALLRDCPDIELAGEASTVDELTEMALRLRPSVLIADAMGDGTDIAATVSELLRRCSPTPGVLVLADEHHEGVQGALRAGANGLVLSRCSAQEFIAAVHLAAAGYRLVAPAAGQPATVGPSEPGLDRWRLEQLTEREFDVLQLVALGFGNAEISKQLTLSESTVKTHIRNILVKLGLRNRVHTVIYAYEVGFVRIGVNPMLRLPDPAATREPVRAISA